MPRRASPPAAPAAPAAAAPFVVEIDEEDDGRWIAGVPALPGCLVYGATRDEAHARVIALALHVLADRIEQGEATPDLLSGMFIAAA